MRRLKYLLIVLVSLGIAGVVGIGLLYATLANRTDNSTSAAAKPIDVNWVPICVDEEVKPILSKAGLADRIAPAVVSIATQRMSYDIFYRPLPESGAGSGVIIDPKGYIVTNNHVIRGARSVKVTLNNGATFEAVRWVGDETTDLAVIQIQPSEDLPYAHFLSNALDKLSILEDVVAVGNALALPGGPTWTQGVVSYLGRSIKISDDLVLDNLIQTDAAINRGNSGGPLINMSGQVVGINTAIVSGAENIGFAISTDTVIPTIYSLVTTGSKSIAWLGVYTITVTGTVKAQYGLSVNNGAMITSVIAGSPAGASNLKPYDVIIKVGDMEIRSRQDLSAAIQSYRPDDTVTITYVRGQATLTAEATLGERPSG